MTQQKKAERHEEKRYVVIYGFTKQELSRIMKHFEAQLPDYVKISIENKNLITKITLTGLDYGGVELLRFKMNRFHSTLTTMFAHSCPTVLGLSSYPKARDRLVTSHSAYHTNLAVKCQALSDARREGVFLGKRD